MDALDQLPATTDRDGVSDDLARSPLIERFDTHPTARRPSTSPAGYDTRGRG